MRFHLVSKFQATGDQPQAIEKISRNIQAGVPHQVLLGVTGSGKTFSMASVIERMQKPALVISPNKTLGAQLFQEFKEFFPHNGIHYFVSYYDYYQPEAYIPQTDTYIEKDAKINDVIDRLRHEAVQDVLSGRDVIVVASVSCIYNIGSPNEYQRVALEITPGQRMSRRDFLSRLAALQYERNDVAFEPGTFRVRGDVIEIYLVTGKEMVRVEFVGDSLKELSLAPHALVPAYELQGRSYSLYPAKFWVTAEDKLAIAMENIRLELQEQLAKLRKKKKLLEAQRLEQRTNFDLEMIQESGYCHGIENYSRHLEFRKPGDPPFTLLDYFPQDLLIFIDESHLTIPQLKAMAVQDRMRKETLVEHGFRLPSAIDNRPLVSEEFFQRARQLIYVSATPGAFERNRSGKRYVVEQLIRPTGLLEPAVEIRPAKNQIQDLIKETEGLLQKNQRVLVITLTKRLAEEIASYLVERNIKTQWLHSEVKTLERPAILEHLRRGEYDVLVGINLLREGLDLPEVALVAILDADKEGFLRNETTLIQTMGRAARHPEGRAILYADRETLSIKQALQEVRRRRTVQEAYNKKHGIVPQPIVKEIRAWPFRQQAKTVAYEFGPVQDVKLLEKEMREAAAHLDFERAAQIRDLIKSLKGANMEHDAHNSSSKKGFAESRKGADAKS